MSETLHVICPDHITCPNGGCHHIKPHHAFRDICDSMLRQTPDRQTPCPFCVPHHKGVIYTMDEKQE